MLTSARAALAILALGATFGSVTIPVSAAPAAPTVTVTGEGSVSRAPDRASIGISIVSSDDSAQTATSKNNVAYAEVVRRLSSLNIAQSAIQTSSYDLTFVPKPEPSSQYKPPRTGYIVTRRLNVTLDDLALVGRTIDAAVAAGATQIDGVTFGLRDARGAYAEALSAAVRDAEAQAGALATAAHLRLGAVQRIDAARGYAVRAQSPMLKAAVAAAPTEIPPSPVQVQASVNIVFALQP